MNCESKNFKKQLNKRMPDGGELDSVIEIEELQEVLKNEDSEEVTDGDKIVPRYKTFVGEAIENTDAEVFIKSPKTNEHREKIRKSLLIKNDNVLTMAQLIKSDKLLSVDQIEENI